MMDDLDNTNDFLDIIIKKIDHDRDGKISFEDYKKTVLKNHDMLEFLGPCLPNKNTVYKMLTTFTKTRKNY